jgi:arylsulfatase A-like enzyme
LIIAVPLVLAGRIAPRLFTTTLQAFVLCAAAAVGVLFLFYPALHQFAILVLAIGIAWQLARRFAALGPAGTRRLWRSAFGGAVLLLFAACVVGGTRAFRERSALRGLPNGAAGAPNVLLLVLDTVRAMSLGLYGYSRPTSPTIDSLGHAGVVFDQAYSAAPWTLPSHASMLTGRYAHELDASWVHPLGSSYARLPDVLAKHGFATAGFVANVAYTSRETGLSRGFAHYDAYRVSLADLAVSSSLGRVVLTNPRLRAIMRDYEIPGRKTAEIIIDGFLSWEAKRAGGRTHPFFAMLNFYDAHEPYLPEAPFDTAFGLAKNRDLSGIRYLNGRMAERTDKTSMTPAQAAEEQLAYDADIAWLDRALSRLFATLRERGLAERTVVVLTADHGEQFGEHGLYSHGNGLYAPSIHVPLLVIGPGLSGGQRIEAPVSLRDLAATILGLTGTPNDVSLPGKSLLSAEGAGHGSPVLSSIEPAPNQDTAYPSAKGPMRSLVLDRHLYIRNGDGREELYDHAVDPLEVHNIASDSTNAPLLSRARVLLDSLGAMPPRASSPNAKPAGRE